MGVMACPGLARSTANKKRQKSATRTVRRQSNFKKIVPKKKCKTCGSDDIPGHTCKQELPVVKRRPVGLRTYYNLSGKKVHDQQTQTPDEFYPKIVQIRAENEAFMISHSVSPRAKNLENSQPLRDSNKTDSFKDSASKLDLPRTSNYSDTKLTSK